MHDVDIFMYSFFGMFSSKLNFRRTKRTSVNLTPVKVDPVSGLTNKELMLIGRAPKGPDGKPINLHHLIQQHDGAIAEMTQTFHQKNSKRTKRTSVNLTPVKVDPVSGLTNKELMLIGRAPKGPDGKPINLHHLIQQHDGAIAEMTQTFHQKNSKLIHINPSSIPSGVGRSAFHRWREAYWKDRVNDF